MVLKVVDLAALRKATGVMVVVVVVVVVDMVQVAVAVAVAAEAVVATAVVAAVATVICPTEEVAMEEEEVIRVIHQDKIRPRLKTNCQ